MALLLGFVIMTCNFCVLNMALPWGLAIQARSSRALEMALLLGLEIQTRNSRVLGMVLLFIRIGSQGRAIRRDWGWHCEWG